MFEAVDRETGARCVVKIMRPVKEARLKREIKILRHVGGGPSIVRLSEVVRDPDTKTPVFVFDFVDTTPLKALQAVARDGDVRRYLYLLLRALDHTHARGIMHRDVKVCVVCVCVCVCVRGREKEAERRGRAIIMLRALRGRRALKKASTPSQHPNARTCAQPANVLIDHAARSLTLIDWGLADFYFPGKEYPVRVATR